MLRWVLTPLSWAYAGAIRARNRYYDRNPRATHAAELPVISIGNLTIGGSGKTPLVIETVDRLLRFGRRPAILTRGYRAPRGGSADEVLEYAQALPDVPVVVDPDRVAGARTAAGEHQADCVVLDDGFQHRRLRRDLDVVVIDALDPWGGGRVLPAGRLREPLSSLRRAGLVVVSRANQVEPETLERIRRRLTRYATAATVLTAEVRPAELVRADRRSVDPQDLAYHCVLPVCGLGNPTTFLRCLEGLAGQLCPPLLFGDHHHYTAGNVRRIAAVARRHGADLVVTTRKDWVKLAALWSGVAEPPLARLDVRLELRDEQGVFQTRLRRALEKRP